MHIANPYVVGFDMLSHSIRSYITSLLGSGRPNCDIKVRVVVNISIPMKIIIFHFNFYFVTQRGLLLLSIRDD